MLIQGITNPKEGIRMLIAGKTFFIHLLKYILSTIGINNKDNNQSTVPNIKTI